MIALYQELVEKSILLKKQAVFVDISSHVRTAGQAVDEPV
jgi:hypothetical protein